MEPNKKIDELLSRYVRERREKTPADFDLHPVPRKLLQDEVARSFAKTGTVLEPKTFVWLWPRLAFASVCTALFAVVLLQLNTPKKSGIDTASLQTEKKVQEIPARIEQADVTEPSDASTDKRIVTRNELASRQTATTPSPRETLLSNSTASEPNPSGLEDAAASRDATVSAGNQIVTLAGKPKANVALSKSLSDSQPESVSIASIPLDAATATAVAPYFDVDAGRFSTLGKFTQRDLRAQYRRNLLSPPQPRILQTFEVAQSGNKIRLLDSDGSIYEGEKLKATNETSEVDSTSGFVFRVSGTNQHLARLITFTGSLSSVINGLNLSAGAKGDLSELKKSSVSKQGIVRGRISMGGTNEFEIQAPEISK